MPWSEVTAALSEALGRPIRDERASVPGYVAHLARQGLPVGAIAVQTVLPFLLRFGQGKTVDPALAGLRGRPGGSLRAYVSAHAGLWATRPAVP